MAEKSKNKGGRPPKTSDDRRSKTVRFRVTPRQMLRLQNRARRSRLTLSEYARNMALDGEVVIPISPEELALIAELTREKNNLNQLAKAQNAAGAKTREAELARIIRFYDDVISKLKRHDR
ncbi:plasmid mobilization protein [Alistipes finegoldii]|uniref:plasmid mobilization protein n=1 Tax=Alistipes finegoldii TaxID=214856 RepID=UPI0030806EED